MANKKKPQRQTAITNRRAGFDYALGDELTTGVVLTGPETRAARDGHVQLKGSFVTLKDNELWLNNASFSVKLNQRGEVGSRTLDTKPRKLLAKRKEIDRLAASRQAGLAIVPLKLLNRGRHIKLVVALGKGKKLYDKRETLKRKDQEREAKRMMKR